MDERFWLACEGEMVLVFQSDSMLCAGAEFALEAFQDLDYVGAPFYPGGAFPPGHEAHGSLPQGSFDEMAVEALLPIPIGGVGGNGGFSLRRRSKMLQVLRECKEHHPFRTWYTLAPEPCNPNPKPPIPSQITPNPDLGFER